jgi:rod shape-determining protein MreC
MLMFSRYTWWVGGMIALAVMLIGASQVGALNPFQSVFLTVSSPFERVLSGMFRPVASVLSSAGDLDSLEAENDRLRLENERLQNEMAGLRIEAQRATELEEALNVEQTAPEAERLAANVLHRDASPFTDVISIDKGSSSGLAEGMAVVSSQGTLMGTITKVLSGHSFVRLITDSESRVAAEVAQTRADGIVKGTADKGLVFDFAQAEVKAGDQLVTSSLTGRYPPGILIGTVTEVTGSPQDLFKTVTVDPAVRISSARTVLVITSFTPQDTSLVEEPE